MRVTEAVPPQPVDGVVPLLLPHIEMAVRMRREPAPAAPLGMHPTSGLLRHRSAREEQRGVGAEQLGEAPFQPGHRPVRAVRRRLGG
jgi:hypothetical protein